MNKVKIDFSKPAAAKLATGDIYVSDADELYILARVDCGEDSYAAICLSDGVRWANPMNIEDAVDGLKLHRRNANITVA